VSTNSISACSKSRFDTFLGFRHFNPYTADFLYLRRGYCHISFKFYSENLLRSIPIANEEKWFTNLIFCALQLHLRVQRLDSTHSWDSGTSIHTLQISCISDANTNTSVSSSILRNYKGVFLLQTKKNCLPVPSTQLYTLKNLEQICYCNILMCVFIFVYLQFTAVFL